MPHPSHGIARLGLAASLITALLAGCGTESAESMIASARAFLVKKDGKSAIIQLRNALQKAPDNGEARFLLGKAQLDSGDLAGAEKELRRALELKQPASEVVPLLARAMLGLGQPRKVIEEMAKMPLDTGAARASLLATVGAAQMALHQNEEARQSFDQALAIQPGQPQASTGLARLKAMNQDKDGAEALVDQVLSREPAQPDALFLKADLLLTRNKQEEASRLYAEVLNTQAENVRAHTSLFMLAFTANRLEAASSALEAMKKALPRHPQTRYLEALLLTRKGELPRAREAIQQALKGAPDMPPALLLAGEIELRLDSPQIAASYLQQALARSPDSIQARRLLTLAYLRSGQSSRALENLKPLLQALPEDSGIRMLAGEVYLGNNDLQEAERHFARASALDGRNSAARTRLGQVKFAEGEVQSGFRELEAAAGMDSATAQADILLAIAHLRRNEADPALAAIANLEKKLPNSPIPANLRAGALLLKGDKAGARRSLEAALSVAPTYFPAALTLARLDVQDRDWEGARKRFEKILEKDPKNFQALLALAQARADSGGKPVEIEELLSHAITVAPTQTGVRMATIRYWMNTRRFDKAISSAQEALAAIPDNHDLLDILGQAQSAAGQTNQATSTFNKLASLQPNVPSPWLRLAGIQLRGRQYELAAESLRRALTIKPDLVDAQSSLVEVYIRLDRQRDAFVIARDAQRQRPRESAGYLLEAQIDASQKKWKEAAAVLRRGIASTPAPALVISLHKVLKADGRNAEAERLLAEWFRDNPRDGMVRTYQAESSLRAGQYDQAFRQFQSVLALQPKNPLLLNNLAWVAGQLKDPRALDYAEQANSLAPNSPAILDTLGMLLVDKGDSRRGLPLLQQALALSPDAHPIRLNLAKAYARSGDRRSAQKELEPLLRLDDRNAVKQEAVAFQKTL